jgi:hypothetical protein
MINRTQENARSIIPQFLWGIGSTMWLIPVSSRVSTFLLCWHRQPLPWVRFKYHGTGLIVNNKRPLLSFQKFQAFLNLCARNQGQRPNECILIPPWRFQFLEVGINAVCISQTKFWGLPNHNTMAPLQLSFLPIHFISKQFSSHYFFQKSH